MRSSAIKVFLGALWLSLMTGCPPTATADAGSNDVVSAIIGASGGSLTNAQGVELEVPAGALDHDVEIAIASVQVGDLNGTLPAATEMAGAPYKFTPHGTIFTIPVTIKLPFTDAADAVLRLDDESDTTWDVMSGANFGIGTAVVDTLSFSIMAPTLSVHPNDGGTFDSNAGDVSLHDASAGDTAVALDAGPPDCVTVCTGAETCMWRPDNYSPNGGYWACTIPCSGNGDCPIFVPECVNSTTITGGGWWCDNGGCIGNQTQFECRDSSGNVTACVDGACQ